ncbi:hypothetical protein CLV84_0832 [Neolewinella xylanilytica]|uniref:Uncharacterized protein n=2 Tax=Neolewinella xylanilytica TaxID=1514080 RepID=A0A2S6I8S2_9BACT|nr:hypothetical protein CLV84_0832 [Neolewinella xylanilytica]
MRITLDTKAYQEVAVQAAREELARRELTEEEVADTTATLEQERGEHTTKARKRHDKLAQIKATAGAWAAAASPIQIGTPDARRKHRILTLLLGVAAAVQLYEAGNYAGLWSPELYHLLDGLSLFLVLLSIGLAAIPVLFWLGKPWGWIVAVLFTGMSLAVGLSTLYESMLHHLNLYSLLPDFAKTEFFLLTELFAPPHPLLSLSAVLYYAAVLWLLTRPEVVAAFPIDRLALTRTYIATGVLAAFALIFQTL